MAIGAGIARRRAGAETQQTLQQQKQPQPQQSSDQEDVIQKLQKLADLKQKGLLTDEEFQKLKMEAISKL
ncbi:MAG: SHOCT domain-containing protein [Candidatus Nitrosopolaris sp.]